MMKILIQTSNLYNNVVSINENRPVKLWIVNYCNDVTKNIVCNYFPQVAEKATKNKEEI